VVPSVWWEIFCLVISEAWANGRPVIASDIGGPRERISDGLDGLLFEMGDARALAAVMRRACEQEGLWDRLAGGITPPADAAAMASAFLSVYAAPAASGRDAA
jgi:glycosyltransferase involved in cell wall biosynthesis